MEKKSSELQHRQRIKGKKPEFLRTDGHKRMKLQRKWRRPAGLHNKMRLNKRGYRRSVTVGWKSPSSVRGLARNGLAIALVHNMRELSAVEPGKAGIVIASTVGQKQRIILLKEALSRNITVLNHKDPQKQIDQAKQKLEAKKKESKQEKKEEVKKDKEKTLDSIADEDEKKEAEKKEKDRILTKKV
jgi:large subunit ribosomal protein L32e